MPPLVLTDRDQRQFTRCLRALVSPLRHENLDGWRSEVDRSMATLLDANLALEEGSDGTVDFHHGPSDGRRSGDGVALLRLLHPAFRAGVAGQRALAEWRAGLARSVDALTEAVSIHDCAGEAQHHNPAMERLLCGPREPGVLERRLAEAARSVAAAARSDRNGSADRFAKAPPTRAVRVRRRRYTLTVTLAGPGALDRDPVVLTLVPADRRLPRTDALERRFGLTPRQAEVALLLAERRTNAEIAERLGISPHTARRHTERALLKLGVASRRQVRRAVTAPVGAG